MRWVPELLTGTANEPSGLGGEGVLGGYEEPSGTGSRGCSRLQWPGASRTRGSWGLPGRGVGSGGEFGSEEVGIRVDTRVVEGDPGTAFVGTVRWINTLQRRLEIKFLNQ